MDVNTVFDFLQGDIVKRVLLFTAIVLVQYILIRLTNYAYRKLKLRIDIVKGKFLKAVYISKYQLFSLPVQEKILFSLLNIVRWVVIIIQLLITIPMLFSIFPQTENLAMQIVSYILNPLKKICWDIIHYIPNLFIILIIWLIIRYVIKMLAYLANEIAKGKLKINGFYPDWAQPTYGIIRFLLYAFMIALIYPYLPDSNSGIFQGMSIFVGVIVSFGSSSAISNVIAGIVITYMRPFQVGDRIKINDIIGNVLEKTPVVVRIQTLKNEIITIPNSTIINTQITDLTESARTKGLIVHLEVTVGYEVPWRQVHQVLIDAAEATPDVMSDPHPFVLEQGFNDFNITYEINAYINDAYKLAEVTSNLRQNIQDKFNAAGIKLLSPHLYELKSKG